MAEKVIILGGGPAGFTAAIYSARAGLEPLLIEGISGGGQLMTTTDVDNFPGFAKGIQGPELVQAMREQVTRFGTRIVTADVGGAVLGKRPLELTGDGKNYFCDSLIIATGASARWLGLPSELALRGKGVSACATCDGFFFKNHDVVVIGGGDTAVEEATYLARIVKSVTVIHRRDKLRASNAMQQRAFSNNKISFVWDSVVSEIKDVSAGRVTEVEIKNLKTGDLSKKKCNGVFIAIGHMPNTSIFKGQLELDKNGYIITKKGSTATSVEGVFAAGDVSDPVYRQAVTAAGTGCMAALDVCRFLGI
ncbi:MAG: thioredoxin-disulfide reductase [Deltaproteobacteria bacterium]|nr:thioredoxin-disulfide reductase [Deltaproteobacteria bacterium]